VEEVVETVFEVPISLGTVMALEVETTAALAGAYKEVQNEVRNAPVKNTDETGWSEKGQKRWLWGAATATVAFFVIHLRRNFEGLQALLGETIQGIVCSDRWAAYSKLPLELRQICWAHLKRDFQALIDSGDGKAKRLGHDLMRETRELFRLWTRYRDGTITRRGWLRSMRLVRRKVDALLLRDDRLALHRVVARRARAGAVRVLDLVPRGRDLSGPRIVVEVRVELAGHGQRGAVHDGEVGVVQRVPSGLYVLLAGGARGERDCEAKHR